MRENKNPEYDSKLPKLRYCVAENGEKVHLGPNEDKCMICGSPIPEGSEICPMCWSMYFGH